MTTDVVPIIDFSPLRTGNALARKDIAMRVGRACEDIGFFMVSGHGIAPHIIERAYSMALAFFDLPEDKKLQSLKPAVDINRGYSPFRSRTVGAEIDKGLKPSLQEGFAIGQPNVPEESYFQGPQALNNFAPDIWPRQPTGFEDAMRAYYRAMEKLSQTIVNVFADTLRLPGQFFAEKMSNHISTLRLVHYPAFEGEPEPGAIRSGEHSDTGVLTILLIDENPGLQVKTRTGHWVDIKRVPDVFIVNIGDMMMQWTNDRWISTRHRVVNPPKGTSGAARRLSIPYFSQPNYDAMIACIETCTGPDNPPKYLPVTSGEHRLKRHEAIYGFSAAGEKE
ncbi:isopenicillin N synthase family oxygenase [Alphaproteobacteria bacterium]|nr:isopenicillin N synthase family oxygenase [Alphaproteobacteria bacterium]